MGALRKCDRLRALVRPRDVVAELRGVVSTPSYVTVPRFGTTVYHLAQENPHPAFPELRVDGRVNVVAFGGSGSGRSNGSAFMRNAASLRHYGVDLISLDYPFHVNGPRHQRYNKAESFLQQMLSIVEYCTASGRPTYVLGHSFGDIVIQELLHHSGQLATGVLMLGPGGNMTPGLLQHYLEFRFSPTWDAFANANDAQWDRRAEVWAEGQNGDTGICGQFATTHHTRLIATDVPVLLMAGEHDPWSNPTLLAEVAHRFANSTLEIVAGAGHLDIFTRKHKRKNILTQRLVRFINETSGITMHKRKSPATPVEQCLAWHERSAAFRRWFQKAGYALEDLRHRPSLADAAMREWPLQMRTIVTQHVTRKVAPPSAQVMHMHAFTHVGELVGRIAAGERAYPLSHWHDTSYVRIGGIPLSEVSEPVVEAFVREQQEALALLGQDPQTLSNRAWDRLVRYALEGFSVNSQVHGGGGIHFARSRLDFPTPRAA